MKSITIDTITVIPKLLLIAFRTQLVYIKIKLSTSALEFKYKNQTHLGDAPPPISAWP